MTKKIVTLSGDGIGPEIMAAGLGVLDKVASKIEFDYDAENKKFIGKDALNEDAINYIGTTGR